MSTPYTLSPEEHAAVERVVSALHPAPLIRPVVTEVVERIAVQLEDVDLLDKLAQAAELGLPASDRSRDHSLLNERFGAVSRG